MSYDPPVVSDNIQMVDGRDDLIVHHTVFSSWLNDSFLACNGNKIFLNWHKRTEAPVTCILCVACLAEKVRIMTMRQTRVVGAADALTEF